MSYRADDQLSHQEYKRESMQKLKENHSELLSILTDRQSDF